MAKRIDLTCDIGCRSTVWGQSQSLTGCKGLQPQHGERDALGTACRCFRGARPRSGRRGAHSLPAALVLARQRPASRIVLRRSLGGGLTWRSIANVAARTLTAPSAALRPVAADDLLAQQRRRLLCALGRRRQNLDADVDQSATAMAQRPWVWLSGEPVGRAQEEWPGRLVRPGGCPVECR